MRTEITDIHDRKQYGTALELVQLGSENCEKGHYFGPAVRDFYLLHYVAAGEGIFKVGDNTYHIGADSVFLIYPGQLTYYEASAENPWEYIWIGVAGTQAELLFDKAGFTDECQVIASCGAREFFFNIKNAQTRREMEIFATAQFYGIVAHLAQNAEYAAGVNVRAAKHEYVERASRIIRNNYMHSISVNGIARDIGLNRSYFYKIFKDSMGMPPQQYIVSCRMARACELLGGTNLRIADVSRSVGYDDEFTFSRMFTKSKGMSPSAYKRGLKKKE